MFNKEKNNHNTDIIKVVSLLIHAAKIDENYTDKEKKLIKNFVILFSKENKKNITDNEALDLIKESEECENNSNQILEFTKEIKKIDIKMKTLVFKTLWEIVLSDNKSGIYENNSHIPKGKLIKGIQF